MWAGIGIAIAFGVFGIAFARSANAQTCTKEQTLTGQYFNADRAPGMRCETTAILRDRATSICRHTGAAVGTFRVEADGCAKDNGRAVFTCCPSRTVPVVKIQPLPSKLVPVMRQSLGTPLTPLRPTPRAAPYVSPIFQQPLNTPGAPLRGYVDLHAHLMNHIGFGGKLLYGGTDVGVLMLSGAVGQPPCPKGWVMDSPGICYSACPDGYRGAGPSCYPVCPSGWTDAGLTCTPPSYGRGAGYVDAPAIYTRSSQGRGNGYSWDPLAQRHNPEPPPGRNMQNGFDRCRYDLGENACEEGSPTIYYPKCATGWEGIGPVCWERCRASFGTVALTCSRSGIDIARERCEKGNPQGCDQVGVIFYPKCDAGYATFGLTCTLQCPAHTTNAGLLCGKQLLARNGPQTSLAKTCNMADTRAANIGDALGSCASTHGGWNLDNTCGDTWRNFVISEFASDGHTVTHDGVREEMPTFVRWPKWNDINHQLMWIDWVKRAHAGGLRVMVALAGNSITLAKVIAGNEPIDDKNSGDAQLDEMHAYATRNAGFVEIARTAADLRRIVGQDKLAIVLGLELDHLGGFGNNAPDPSADQVRAEIRRLHGKDVRYVIPIHAADNSFGGTALYEPMFLFGNLFQTGRAIDAVCAADSEKIGKRVNGGKHEFLFKALGITEVQRFPDNCRVGVGFKNSRHLQALGRVAIDEMMSLGMIIDVDHSDHNTTREIIDYTGENPQTMSQMLKNVGGAYPLVTGHNSPRPAVASDKSSERSLTLEHYSALARRGSIAGVGSDSAEAGDWMASAQMVMNQKMPIAFGSDVNGFANLPRPPWANEHQSDATLPPPAFACASAGTIGTTQQCIEYLDDQGNKPPGSTATFKRAKTGERAWDYNAEGVAHFGLFPDFLKDVERRGGTAIVTDMYQGAEKFAVSWMAAEAIAEKIKLFVPRQLDRPDMPFPKGGQYQAHPPR